MSAFRVYEPDELAPDGYPPEWHATLKHAVRAEAGHRCVRCRHPYRTGEHPMEREVDDDEKVTYVSWSPCDDECRHDLGHGDVRAVRDGERFLLGARSWEDARESWHHREARARILTVHHLDGDKANCRWWNLAALCQRCHLTIQGRVVMARVWPWEHTEWFRPYVAGYYAHAYLSEDLDRDAVMARLDELLALERAA